MKEYDRNTAWRLINLLNLWMTHTYALTKYLSSLNSLTSSLWLKLKKIQVQNEIENQHELLNLFENIVKWLQCKPWFTNRISILCENHSKDVTLCTVPGSRNSEWKFTLTHTSRVIGDTISMPDKSGFLTRCWRLWSTKNNETFNSHVNVPLHVVWPS